MAGPLKALLKWMSRSGDTPLFHITEKPYLGKILEDDELRRSEMRGPFVSLTRNPRYHGWNPEGHDVQLILSKDSISKRHPLRPIEEPRNPRLTEEREERIPRTALTSLSDHLRGINYVDSGRSLFDNNILIQDPEHRKQYITEYLNELSIPKDVPVLYKGEALSPPKYGLDLFRNIPPPGYTLEQLHGLSPEELGKMIDR